MKQICPFCGSRADSHEHVWPQWLSKFLANRSTLTVEVGSVESDEKKGLRRYTTPIVNETTSICRRCNEWFDARIEQPARPILLRMIDGVETSLDITDQLRVAAWATKTLMMLELIYPEHERCTLQADREWVRSGPADGLVPPDRFSVWVAAYLGNQTAGHVYQAGTTTIHETGESGRTFVSTTNVGHLVLQVAGHNLRRGLVRESRAVEAGVALKIWQIRSPHITWPPPRILDDRGLDGYARQSLA